MPDMMGDMLLRSIKMLDCIYAYSGFAGKGMPPISHFTSARRIKKGPLAPVEHSRPKPLNNRLPIRFLIKTVKTFQIVLSISVSKTSFSLNEKHLSKTGAD